MDKKTYKFKCKNCEHEYLSRDHKSDCSKCGESNQTIGKLTSN